MKLSAKLILIFVAVMIIPLAVLTYVTWRQFFSLGYTLRDISVSDTTRVLNDNSRDRHERMTADTAALIADFFYQRDRDVLLLAEFMPSDEAFMVFSRNRNSSSFPLYDEITFVDLDGQEMFKYTTLESNKVNYPLEAYWEELLHLQPGEIYVSDVIGAYVPSGSAFAEVENPTDEQFKGIMRWATPVVDFDGEIWGYVTMALNYDHILLIEATNTGIEDFTYHAVAMEQRLNEAISQNTRNYAFQLVLTSTCILMLILAVAVIMASSVTGHIKQLNTGFSRFRNGERHFRMNSKRADEFGELADAFDEMADSLEESSKSPVVITNNKQEIIYINSYALNVLGLDIQSVTGIPYSIISIYPTDSPSDPIAALHEDREAEVFLKEDTNHYYSGKANYLFDKDGNKTGYIITSSDVTEIEVARQKAEQASIAKGNFLSNMSHEIRTPLNAIIGMTSIGTASDDIEKKDYSLNKIDEASKHLLGIINDILDVSKIEANKYSLSPAPFIAEEMILRVVDVINFRVEQKRQKLTVHIDSSIPEVLIGDDQRLSQVITNLLSNSVKFTAEEGSIHLDVILDDECDEVNEQCVLQVVISDTGIGISSEQQERLFGSFEQAEASTSRRFGGTGLGLMISKSIIEMMDGEIWVDSELGEGTVVTFTVRLGYEKDSQLENTMSSDAEDDEAAVNFEGYTVLLVEDVEINREIVMALLEPTGLTVECAENGTKAVEAFKSNPDKYDLIFMDIQMPEMDGFTATQLIRESGLERATEVPIVAMTANAFKEDIEKCLASGMNAHIGKPLVYDIVISTLEEYL